jgi:hypothetical protein
MRDRREFGHNVHSYSDRMNGRLAGESFVGIGRSNARRYRPVIHYRLVTRRETYLLARDSGRLCSRETAVDPQPLVEKEHRPGGRGQQLAW